MWENVKYYALAFAIILAGALVSTGFQLLEGIIPEIHPLNKLVANLSGVTFGGVIMLLGFLRDKRLDDERKRTATAQVETKNAKEETKTIQAELKTVRAEAKTAQEEAAQQRLRAERAEAELQRLRVEQDAGSIAERLRRLEELNGIADPEPDSEPRT